MFSIVLASVFFRLLFLNFLSDSFYFVSISFSFCPFSSFLSSWLFYFLCLSFFLPFFFVSSFFFFLLLCISFLFSFFCDLSSFCYFFCSFSFLFTPFFCFFCFSFLIFRHEKGIWRKIITSKSIFTIRKRQMKCMEQYPFFLPSFLSLFLCVFFLSFFIHYLFFLSFLPPPSFLSSLFHSFFISLIYVFYFCCFCDMMEPGGDEVQVLDLEMTQECAQIGGWPKKLPGCH